VRVVAGLASLRGMGGVMVDGLDAGMIAELRAALDRAPTARAAVATVLDRLAARGRRPRRVTVAIDPPGLAALRAVFSARAVTWPASPPRSPPPWPPPSIAQPSPRPAITPSSCSRPWRRCRRPARRWPWRTSRRCAPIRAGR
jgi:hypothetical protein